jgi:hypothetical protein
LIALLVACNTNGTVAQGGSGDRFFPPWASTAIYRESTAQVLGAVSVPPDTAESVSEDGLHAWGAADGGDWTWTAGEGRVEAEASVLVSLTFSAADALSITAGAASYDPPVVLVPAAIEEGVSTTSGGWKTTPQLYSAFVTWYGTFDEVLCVDIEGEGELAGGICLAEGVGPVRWALGGVGADLVWYE